MDQITEFSAEDLEILELPQREALGKGNSIKQNGNKSGGGLLGIGPIAILIDLL